MSETILVGVAWPYGNADIHQGNVTGSYLPADIFTRYHRLQGNNVLMVSGTDSHGTPVTVKAEAENTTPNVIFERYHSNFIETFKQLGLTYDLFTHTDTENHHQVAQDVFSQLLQNEYLYRKVTDQFYSPNENRFLPDRYIEGTCPNCGYERARGDQCDNCNTLFETPQELVDPRSTASGSELELRQTEHYYIDLEAIATDGLVDWLNDENKAHWRAPVINFSRHFAEELHGRAITRDMDWGISIPGDLPGFENKVMYVWFEAVIGYLSATIEWAKNAGTPDAWRNWWTNRDARTLYFVGKDNIPFHAIFWPAELLGTKGLYSDDPQQQLNLPYDVPANQFMNMEGRKISGSRNWGVWILDALERHDPDPLRYYLTALMPETRDSDWSWQGYVDRNNNELVANWGNLVNRVLSMTVRYFDGAVPDPIKLTTADEALLAAIDAGFEEIGQLYDQCKFRAAMQEAMALSTLVNQYLEDTSPWKTAKTDREATARSLYTCLQAISGLKILFAPVLPFTSQQLHTLLGEEGALFGEQHTSEVNESSRAHTVLTYDGSTAVGSWRRRIVPIGRKLTKPTPLYRKLDDAVIEDELNRIGNA